MKSAKLWTEAELRQAESVEAQYSTAIMEPPGVPESVGAVWDMPLATITQPVRFPARAQP